MGENNEFVNQKVAPILMQNVILNSSKGCVLDKINFTVHHRERILILGPNASGKSSLLKTLAGLLKPEGDIKIFGNQSDSINAKRMRAYLPQEIDYPPKIRVSEVVDFVAEHYPDTKYNVKKLLRQYDLNPREDAGHLSGGQKRRLALLLALIGNPKLLLLDEPEAGLDVQFRESAIQEIISEVTENNLTLIMASHMFENVTSCFTRILVMKSGKLIADFLTAEFIALKENLRRWDIYGENIDKISVGYHSPVLKRVVLGNQYCRAYTIGDGMNELQFQSDLGKLGFLTRMAQATMEDVYLYLVGK